MNCAPSTFDLEQNMQNYKHLLQQNAFYFIDDDIAIAVIIRWWEIRACNLSVISLKRSR